MLSAARMVARAETRLRFGALVNGPLLLAASLGLALLITLALAIAVSVNERRRSSR